MTEEQATQIIDLLTQLNAGVVELNSYAKWAGVGALLAAKFLIWIVAARHFDLVREVCSRGSGLFWRFKE